MSITALGTFYKALFGSSVAACRIACSEISFSIHEKEKKAREVRERVGHEQFCRWCDGELVLAELFTLYSDRTRSFNQ